MTRVEETYNLLIVIPDFPGTDDDLQALARLPKLLEAVEEDLALLLPEGWTVRIRPTGEDNE